MPNNANVALPPVPTTQTFNAVFPPIYYDTPEELMVAGFDVAADDHLTAAITAGSPYFKVSRIDVCNWIIVDPPLPPNVVALGGVNAVLARPLAFPPLPGVPPGPLPPPPRRVLSAPVATSDGTTPLTVKQGQYARLWVIADVPKGAMTAGPFLGKAQAKGDVITTVVGLQGTYLGNLIGSVLVNPPTAAPGQPVQVQVLDAAGKPLSDPSVNVTIQGVETTSRYYQFGVPGSYGLLVAAARGSLRESANATVVIAGAPLAYRFTLAPPVTAVPILQVSQEPGLPYVATFSLGTPVGSRRLLVAAHPAAAAAAPALPAMLVAPTPVNALGDAVSKAMGSLPKTQITQIAPVSTPTATGTATTSASFAPVVAQTPPMATSYQWDFGDGSTVTTQAPVVTHDFFAAIQAGKVAHSFDVSCTIVHDNLAVKRTLVLQSAYGLCRQFGVVVPPVSGDFYATFQQVAFSGSIVVHNLEASPIVLNQMACVAFSDDSSVTPAAPQFTAMKNPVQIQAKSVVALGVYVPTSQLQDAKLGPKVNGFTVYYSGTMTAADGSAVPVRFSYSFRIALSDSGVVNETVNPVWTMPNWDLNGALQAVAAIATDPAASISTAGVQTVDPATGTVAIPLSATGTPSVAALAQIRSAVQAGLTHVAVKTGALSATPLPAVPRLAPAAPAAAPVAAVAAARVAAAAAVNLAPVARVPAPGPAPVIRPVDLIIDPGNPPPVAEGNQCYPDDISDADAASANAQQLVCQLTGQTQTVEIPGSFQNALQGDVILSPAPVSGGDMIAAMFRALTPAQHHGHSGIMTSNYYEITHCTSSPERIAANVNTTLGVPTSLNGNMLQYSWPGSLTQSVDDATTQTMLKDPGGTAYPFNSFNPQVVGDGFELIPPLVVKPLPENEVSERPTLRKAADTARSKGARYDSTGNLVQAGGCYYSFYCYTKPEIAAGFTDAAGADAGWAQGMSPAVCSSFVWLSVKENQIPLVTSNQYEKLSDFSQLAIAGGAQVGAATLDGLIFYPQAERLQGAQALKQMFMNQALSKEGGFGTIPGINEAVAGPLADQLINCFASGDPNKAGSSDWQTPGDGNAVSPDNIIWWNPPYYGYAEPLQYLPKHSEQYTPSAWKKVITRGTITGTVQANGAPVANAHVWVYQPGGDTYTAGDGSFTLPNIPIGSYNLSASAVITQNGIPAEYDNLKGPAPVTLSAASPTVTANIVLTGAVQNFRRLDMQYSLSCDHGDANPWNTHGVQTTGTYTSSVDVNPGLYTNSYTYSYDYNGGGYFHIDYLFSVALVADLSLEVSIQATMYNDGDNSVQLQYTVGPLNIPMGGSYSGWMTVEHDGTGYHNGPATLNFTLTNAQQTG
jgi:hypothetical protein